MWASVSNTCIDMSLDFNFFHELCHLYYFFVLFILWIMDHSFKSKFLFDSIEVGCVRVPIMGCTSVGVGFVMYSIPYYAIVSPTDNGIAHRKRESSPESFDEKGKYLSTFLWIWDVANSWVTIKALPSCWVDSIRELVPNFPCFDSCWFPSTSLICERPLHVARWHVTFDDTVSYHTGRAV